MLTDESVGAIVDLFCGCGGFSLGAELAGFRSLAAVDVEPVLQSSYRRNFPRSRALEADVSQLDSADWRVILNGTRPDGVVGGPPCQGFSWIGKRKAEDPRNTLVSHFFRHVSILRPRFFIMENVEGILHGDHRLILDVALDEVPPAYEIVGPLLVSAADYGAATKRKRVVILGYLKDEFPVVSSDDLQAATAHRSSVREAISDLPRPIPASTEKDDLGWAPYPDLVERLSDYAVAARSAPPAGLGSREARDRHNAGLVSGQFETVHSDAIRERYLSIEGGRSDPITKSYKLEWEGQCPTLRAGTGRERGAFQAVRPLHPDEGRVISVREAARLQGFPDWFEFHPTKWQSFRMIGNSVSPYVSFGILQAIARKLQIRLAA